MIKKISKTNKNSLDFMLRIFCRTVYFDSCRKYFHFGTMQNIADVYIFLRKCSFGLKKKGFNKWENFDIVKIA